MFIFTGEFFAYLSIFIYLSFLSFSVFYPVFLPHPFAFSSHTLNTLPPSPYRTFYAWFPLWGVVLSLLYLAASRNASSLKRRQLPPPPSIDPDQDRPSDSFSQPLLYDLQRGPADCERGAPSPSASMASGYSSAGSRSHSSHSFTASDVFFRALGLENHPHPSSDLSDRTTSFN